MAAGNSVNDEIKEQRQKLKGKSPKEKFAYFWEYYKIHTLITLLVLIFGGNFIYTIATRQNIVMEAAFVNMVLAEEFDSEQEAADFVSWAGIDSKECEAVLDTGIYIDYDGGDEYTAVNIQKVMAMVSARALDVILTDDSYLEQTADQGYFADLTEVLPEEMIASFEEQGKLLYWDIPEDDKREVPIAVDVRDSSFFLSHEVPAWFCIVSNAEHPDNGVKFLEYMLLDE